MVEKTRFAQASPRHVLYYEAPPERCAWGIEVGFINQRAKEFCLLCPTFLYPMKERSGLRDFSGKDIQAKKETQLFFENKFYQGRFYKLACDEFSAIVP